MRNVLLPNLTPQSQHQQVSGAFDKGNWFQRNIQDNDAVRTGMLHAGLAMLENSGPGGGSFGQALARGIGTGFNAYHSVNAGQQETRYRMGMAGALQRMVEGMDLSPERKAVLMQMAATGDAARVNQLAAQWAPQAAEDFTLGQNRNHRGCLAA